jgi:hypothetical protein
MNKYLKFASLVAVVVVVALASASAVFAQGPTPPRDGTNGRGPLAGNGVLAEYADLMHAPVAKALGLTLDEFDAALADGKTPLLLAQEKGVDVAVVLDALQAGREAALKQAVADGVITQEQADWIAGHAMGAGRAGSMGRSMMGRGSRVGGFGGYNGTCPFTTTP